MKKSQLLILTTASLSILLYFSACDFFDSWNSSENYETFKPDEATINNYHSDQNPGKWKDQAIDHVPQFKTIYNKKDKKNISIKVNIPFMGTRAPLHYIETIILADHNHNEMQKVDFLMGNEDAQAVFMLPKDYKSYIYIISKCNLHDMWEARVDLDDQKN